LEQNPRHQDVETWVTEPHESDEGCKIADKEANSVDKEMESLFDDTDMHDEEEHRGPVPIETNEGNSQAYSADYLWRAPPCISEARAAKENLEKILRPRRDSGHNYKDPRLDLLLSHRLEL